MVAPLVAGAILASALANIGLSYSDYKAVQRQSDYITGYNRDYQIENARFFHDYKVAHHWSDRREIRYPYRSGYIYNMSNVYGADSRKVSGKNRVYHAMVSGLVPFGFVRSGGYRSNGNYASVMYG